MRAILAIVTIGLLACGCRGTVNVACSRVTNATAGQEASAEQEVGGGAALQIPIPE